MSEYLIMKNKERSSLFIMLCLLISCVACNDHVSREVPAEVNALSPDGKVEFKLKSPNGSDTKGLLSYTVDYKGREVIIPSSIKVESNHFDFAQDFSIVKVERDQIDEQWENSFGEKRIIPNNYTQLTVYLEHEDQKINLISRVYNEGVAFAYEIPRQAGKDSIVITDEHISFGFPENHSSWTTYSAQGVYEETPIDQIEKGAERPLVIQYDSTLSVALTEARMVNYARMKFGPDSLSPHGLRTVLDGEVNLELPFQSPWRVVMIAENEGELLEKNYLVQNLNDPSAIDDTSWIKPGKALRDGTLTTAGGKASIDFAANHGMQYVEFDAGWYGPENDEASDATTITLDPSRSKGPFDLHEIIEYGQEKGIGVILYVNRRALEKQLDEILPLFKEWGVAGIKYGFVRVGDQEATTWLHEAVKKAADHGFIVDVHDEYRPTGFSRTYPNLLTQEGIRGDEEIIPNSHTLITMFTRMLAGAGDNTISYYSGRVPTEMGSHASQLAKAVCLASPLQFLYWYDRPSTSPDKQDAHWGETNVIGNEPELEFFDNVPTTWDDTEVIHGKIGEYAVIARRKGSEWFLGGINNPEERSVSINFDFLEEGRNYTAKIYSDDPTVNTRTHVRIDELQVDQNSEYTIDFGANNGIAMHVVPEEQNKE